MFILSITAMLFLAARALDFEIEIAGPIDREALCAAEIPI